MYKKYLSESKLATHIRLGVGIILHSDRKILLEKRSDCLQWGLIGGSIEIGEEVEETAVRECLEETSLIIKKRDLNFQGIYSDCKQNRIIQYPDSCFHAIDIIYTCKTDESKIIIKSEESLEISYFEFKSLPLCIVPPAKLPINDFIKKYHK